MPILLIDLIVDDGDGPENIGYLHAETPVGIHTPVSPPKHDVGQLKTGRS